MFREAVTVAKNKTIFHYKRMQKVKDNKWGRIHPDWNLPENQNRTVAEVNTEHAKQMKDRRQWEKDEAKGFSDFLDEEGLLLFHEVDNHYMKFTASWGHNHGLAIDYGMTVRHSDFYD